MTENIYLQLKKEAAYALKSKNISLAYQVYGEIKMAFRLDVLSKEQFLTLNNMVVTNGLNSPSAFADKMEIEQAIIDFTKAMITKIDEGLISHSSDIVDFATEYLENDYSII